RCRAPLRFFCYCDSFRRALHSFPTRRSSDLTMYVSNQTFAVLRADYAFYPGRVGEKINLRLILGIKFIENNKAGSVAYKKNSDGDRKSTRLNSSHVKISYAVFCLKKKNIQTS